MSERFPRITANQFIKVLEKLGFKFVRQKGSHKVYRNNNNVRAVVPFHSGQIVHIKIIKQFLKDANLNLDEFKEYL